MRHVLPTLCQHTDHASHSRPYVEGVLVNDEAPAE